MVNGGIKLLVPDHPYVSYEVLKRHIRRHMLTQPTDRLL